jgi:iron complex transport system substrate-binding protein
VQAVADGLPKLGGEYVPGAFAPVQREDMLSADPDLVIGGWPSNFDASLGALTRDDLSARGINSYFAYAAACGESGPVTDLSVVYQDILNFGTIFDVEDAANALVAHMQGTIADAQARIGDAPRPTVLSYSWEDGRGDAYAVGNRNVGNAIITQAGGENIFDDVDAVYGTVSWEEVVARNPDAIVIEVFGKPTQEAFDAVVAEAEAFFTSDPALQNVTAVKEGNFIPVVAETYYVGGVRNADAVAALAAALHPDAFGQ